ncbi:MAG: trigger factor [Propionibacteriaceae bacterium]|nr:trigger factor [Propionibacteriaceae bacterium]
MSPSHVKITMTVTLDDLQPAIDKTYKDIARNINLPGFRKGHVPASLIDQRYGRGSVVQEALNAQFPDLYNAAVTENDLKPLGQPEVDIVNLDDGEVIELTAEVDVRPDFELPDVADIIVTVDPDTIDDAAVNERLDLLRQRFATYNDLDRAAEAGDVVVIDLAASQGGIDLPEADAAGMTYIVGSGGLVDGLDKAVTGLKAGGHKKFSTKLVGGEHAGEKADVTVTVNKVQERVLPRVDDDFAQLVSEYDTSGEMLDGLRDGLERMARVGQVNQARDRVLDALAERTDFELPPKVLEAELEGRRQDIEDQLAGAGFSLERYLSEVADEPDKTPEDFWDELSVSAEKNLRSRLILDKLADDATDITVTQEDLSELIVNRAQEDGVTPDQEAQHMMEHNHLAEWMGEIRRGKALMQLVSRVAVKDTDGRKVDISRIRPDGTLGEMTTAEAATTPEPAKAAKAAKAKKKA